MPTVISLQRYPQRWKCLEIVVYFCKNPPLFLDLFPSRRIVEKKFHHNAVFRVPQLEKRDLIAPLCCPSVYQGPFAQERLMVLT